MNERVMAVGGFAAAPLAFLLAGGGPLPAQDPIRQSGVCLDCHGDSHAGLYGTPRQILPLQMDNAPVLGTE